jgi:hypothetical protein
MKKMIALALILMISVVVIGGCTSTPSNGDNLQPPALPEDNEPNAPSIEEGTDTLVPPAFPED